VPTLRGKRFVREFRNPLRQVLLRGSFRVVHYSVLRNHLHLVVEAAGRDALGRGMKAVGARLARAANRVFGRSGPVVLGRYHVRALRTPREVRNALACVPSLEASSTDSALLPERATKDGARRA